MTLEIVIRNDTIQVKATVYEYGSTTLMDPDSHSIQLYDKFGVASGAPATTPTRVSIGLFTQTFVIPVAGLPGRWKIRWTTTTGGANASEDVYFDVKA